MRVYLAEVLIVGCSRSGTMYMSEVLRELGLDVRHERMGRDGAVSWRQAKGRVFRMHGCPVMFAHTFHQVRAPLPSISSMATMGPQAWHYAYTILPEVDPGASTLLRSMQLWYYLNQRFERQAERTFRIENIDEVLPDLCETLGVRFSKKALKSVPRNVNSREHMTAGWSELFVESPSLTSGIMGLAGHYGYVHRPEDMHRVRK